MSKKYISPYKDAMKFPDVITWGAFGVQWRGQDVPLHDSPYPDDYTATFGFTCAFCGTSSINAEKHIHAESCDKDSEEKYINFHKGEK
jgi:hypothetical protein